MNIVEIGMALKNGSPMSIRDISMAVTRCVNEAMSYLGDCFNANNIQMARNNLEDAENRSLCGSIYFKCGIMNNNVLRHAERVIAATNKNTTIIIHLKDEKDVVLYKIAKVIYYDDHILHKAQQCHRSLTEFEFNSIEKNLIKVTQVLILRRFILGPKALVKRPN